MKVSFDSRGYLKPYHKLELEFNEFKEIFVDAFDHTSSRHLIFENYSRFLQDFSIGISESFTHWIDGSFVTRKVNPRDIDFVTIIDFDTFVEKEALIERQFRLFGAKAAYQVDAYTIRKYPEGHEKYIIYQGELVYWENWFGWTKKNRAKAKFPKGFIEINFINFKG